MNKRKVKGTSVNNQKNKAKSLIDSKNLERNVLNEIANDFNNRKK